MAAQNIPQYIFAEAASAGARKVMTPAFYPLSSTSRQWGCPYFSYPGRRVTVTFKFLLQIHLLATQAGSSQLNSNLISEPVVEAPRVQASDCASVKFCSDYQSVATQYSRNSHCNKSMRWIKTVPVQLNTRPRYVGDGEAGGGGAAGTWRPQSLDPVVQAPGAHSLFHPSMMSAMISSNYDIRGLRYHKLMTSVAIFYDIRGIIITDIIS